MRGPETAELFCQSVVAVAVQGSSEVGHLDADDLVQPVDQFGQASRVPLDRQL